MCLCAVLAACSSESEDPEAPSRKKPLSSQSPSAPQLPERYSDAHWPTASSAPENEWVEKFINAETDEERIALLDQKEASGPEFLPSMIRRALKGSALPVKIQAIESTRHLEGEDAVDLLSVALSDESKDVSILAMEVARGAPFEDRLAVHKNAFGSPHPEVREMAIIELMRERNKIAFTSIFAGLDDPAPEVQEATSNALAKMLGQSFRSREVAATWWSNNAHRYNERMVMTQEPE